MQNNNDSILDLLSILSIILQLQIMEEQKFQSNNDDIMNELQKQDKSYLERILNNQEIIIEQLNRLTDRFD